MSIPSPLTRCLALAWFSVLASLPAPAASYIEPELTKDLFKLEKIPLQVDRMKELSRHLVVLAKRRHDGNAAQQRATAQLIALAARLDPSNQEARDVNRDLASGKNTDPADEASMTRAKARIRFFKRWLAQPDAGEDANLLSGYLVDATKTLSPETAGNKDLGDWKQTVPPLGRYSRDIPPERPRGREPDGGDSAMKRNGDDGKKPPAAAGKLHLAQLSASTPCILVNSEKYRDEKDFGREKTRRVVTRAISRIKIEIKPCKKEEKRRLEIRRISPAAGVGKGQDDPLFKAVASVLLKLAVSRHPGLGHYKSTVTIPGGFYARSNKLALTGPLAVMLEASASNRPLRDDLHICADIDSAGRLRMNEGFWSQLETLRNAKAGGRLIVPKESAELLMQLLVFGESGFFTRWEVFAVDTLDKAMDLAAVPAKEEPDEAEKLFQSVRDLAEKSPVTKIATNRVVRSRLSKIIAMSPDHVSARALLLQGSSKRPRHLSRKALAHAIIPAVARMHKAIALWESKPPTSGAMKKAHTEAREALDPLENLVDRSNNEPYKAALGLANDFRSLSLQIRRIRDRDGSESAKKKVRAECARISARLKDLLGQARETAGSADPDSGS